MTETLPPGPRFAHHCEACRFLGPYETQDPADDLKPYYDLYFCEQGKQPTVIARYGEGPPEYLSGIHFALIRIAFVKPLREALERAIARGIIAAPKGFEP